MSTEPDGTTDGLVIAIADALGRLKMDSTGLHEGDRADLLGRLATLRSAKKDLDLLLSLVVSDLAQLMEKNKEIIDGCIVERSRSFSTKWDNDAYDREIRHQLFDRLSVDPETGEVNQGRRHLLEVFADAYLASYNKATPSATAATKVYGLNVDEYRTLEPGAWTIAIDGSSR